MEKEKIEIQVNDEIVNLKFLGDAPIGFTLSIPMLREALEYYSFEKTDLKASVTSS